MIISELIKLLQEKMDKYWDVEIKVRKSLWYWGYDLNEIYSVMHLWEDWLLINI